MTCESCDNKVAVWSVCVDEKRNTSFAVCNDCFKKNKQCWTAFVRLNTYMLRKRINK